MTFDQLEMLAAIVETGSFKGAADRLGKSQPSISMGIKKLEEEFKILLFSRDSYRPTLTGEGRAFYEKSKKALDSYGTLYNFATKLSEGIEAEVSISVDAICPLEKLKTPLWTYFYRPDSSILNLTTDILHGTEEKVERGDVDLGIGPLLYDSPLVESFPLLKVEMIPVIAPVLLSGKTVDKEYLKEFPFIQVRDTGTRNYSDEFNRLGEDRKWYVTDSSLKKEMIVHGLGWGRLPSHHILEELKTGKLIPIKIEGFPDKFSVDLHLMRHKKRMLGPVATAIWEYLKSGTHV